MSEFKDLVKNIGYDLKDYAKGAWDVFLQRAAEELTGLSEYYVLGEKNVSLLRNNLGYIKDSVSTVNGKNDHYNNNGRKEFTYYSAKGEGFSSTNQNYDKPILADPSNDKGPDYLKGGEPYFYNDETTSSVEGGKRQSYEFGEYESNALRDGSYSGEFEDYHTINEDKSSALVTKTNQWFVQEEKDYIGKRFATLVSRFHTGDDTQPKGELKNSVGNTSYSGIYGLSHGRNLLKLNPDKSLGYDNPYCRVWTWHHQYSKYVKDTIRPLVGENGKPLRQEELYGDEFKWSSFRGSGHNRLGQYGAMYDNSGRTNGLVNITPSWSEADYDNENNVGIRHCMLSIENLAWKGSKQFDDLSVDQKGPLGGRIMWFPPYDITFNENSNARWDENTFIGRGEPIYTYSNTSRSGTLHFKLLIDHPAILDYWERRDETTNGESTSVDDTESKEQTLLRFFAGCDVLKAKDNPSKGKATLINDPSGESPEGANGNQNENGDNQDKKKEQNEPEKKFYFMVFYPNNYSGKSDKNGPVNPIDYLVNGVGAQMRPSDSDPKVPQDFGVNMNSSPVYMGTFAGGYEIQSDSGISLVTSHTPTNTFATVTIGDSEYTLMKEFDVDRKRGTPESTEGMTEEQKEEWNKSRWYYRVDKDEDVINQVLTNVEDSYIDKVSYQLNSLNYTEGATYFGLNGTDGDESPVFSLLEVYVALCGDNNGIFGGLYSESAVETLKSIFDGSKGRITKVICKGRASYTGYNPSESVNESNNKKLAENRAKTIQSWFIGNLKQKNVKTSIDFSHDRNKAQKRHDANEKEAKLNQMALVEVYYVTNDTVDASETNISINADGSVEDYSMTVTNTPQGYTDSEKQVRASFVNTTLEKPRYDEEWRFFNKLEQNSPFMTRLLCEKVKYFNPVFHSMSPEGFNARLTFLNQCMRQGPTISGSDTDGNNPNNLSFGRPPVCVLRLGDFYYTKIIVTSLQITYDPLTWDLNHEGIGVMPMIADVTLSFNFIGGSDLGGPIQRLQNALSFNYYANTGVYDNRTEAVDYNNGGNNVNLVINENYEFGNSNGNL